jgi:hypothetical protein
LREKRTTLRERRSPCQLRSRFRVLLHHTLDIGGLVEGATELLPKSGCEAIELPCVVGRRLDVTGVDRAALESVTDVTGEEMGAAPVICWTARDNLRRSSMKDAAACSGNSCNSTAWRFRTRQQYATRQDF